MLKNRVKPIVNIIAGIAILLAIAALEIYIFLRENGLVQVFTFKDIFFRGGTLDSIRFCDMRMTMMYCWTSIIHDVIERR